MKLRFKRDGSHVGNVRPSVSAQRLASLMAEADKAGSVARHDGESDADYFRRLRKFAVRVQHEQRRAKRNAAHDQRVRNQKAARAARKRNR